MRLRSTTRASVVVLTDLFLLVSLRSIDFSLRMTATVGSLEVLTAQPVAVTRQATPIATSAEIRSPSSGQNQVATIASSSPSQALPQVLAAEIAGVAETLTTICDGKHALLPGVNAFILSGVSRKVLVDPTRRCPNLSATLQRHDATENFDLGLDRIAKAKDAKRIFGGAWCLRVVDEAFSTIQNNYLAPQLQIYGCERISDSKTYQWLEIIDRGIAPDYVAQYARANLGTSVIEVPYLTIKFPRGVYVEELKQRESRSRLRDYTPPAVIALMQEHDLRTEYADFVEACLATEYRLGPKWDPEKLRAPIENHRKNFIDKGVDLHISYKVHRHSGGPSSVHLLHIWLEYVDLSVIPNYIPQRAVGFGIRAGNNAFTANNILGTRAGYKKAEIECTLS